MFVRRQKGYLRALTCLKSSMLVTMILIPKIPDPEEIGHFWPISLCKFVYKIIYKTLANQLKKHLNVLISENQSAFFANRQIQDSIVIAHKAFHYLRRKRSGLIAKMAIQLDLNKVYDRVEWDFLEAILLKMGFRDSWVKLIIESMCILGLFKFCD